MLQTGTVEAGNYSRCSNGCSAAKCANKSVAEQCAEWCEGIPALEAVFNACKAKQPVGEHPNLDAAHRAEQVRQGRAPVGGGGGGGPLAALPNTVALYTGANVQAFCQAYAGNKAQLLIDHGANVEEKIATTNDPLVPNPGDIQIQRSGNAGNQNVHIRENGDPAKLVQGHIYELAAPSNQAAVGARAIYPNGEGIIFFRDGIAAIPAGLHLKGLCKF